MRPWLGKAAMLVLGITVLVPGHTVVATADQNGVAGIEFTGTGFLDPFPCPIGVTCSGSFQGSANGHLAGVNGVVPWSVTVAAGTLNASFLFNDVCEADIPNLEVGQAAIGFATGNGLVTASLGGAPIGTYGPNPNGPIVTPSPIIALEAPFSFSWTRVGATAAVTATGSARVLVSQPGGPVWIDVAANDTGRGVAAFIPTTGEAIPTCAEPDFVTAFVVGGNVFAS